MSGNWLVFLELLLLFGVVFGFGFYELWKLKQYRRETVEREVKPNSKNDNQSS